MQARKIERLTQKEVFSAELLCLKISKPLPKSNKLLPLCVFLDKDGIM